MPLDPWYKIVTPRKEVREGRSFNPDEFAIALEQVVAGTAPEDYRDPDKFFARTCWTRALREHASLVLRRLGGETVTTAPVLTLITQFGGGKTHTLTALYHLVNNSATAGSLPGVADLLREASLSSVPPARAAVFVGNAWDPQDGRETPWIDLARQLAGDDGVAALGKAAKDSPPGTDTLNQLVELAGGSVLLLFDEVLNGLSRHKWLAEPFHAFLHNIVRGFVGTTHRAAVVSLPRSQVEMTEWDLQWQEKIQKIMGAVAKPLIVADEAEVAEVVRRRLFEDIAEPKARVKASKAYADWCFERRAQLPTEWTSVDTATTEAKAREYLQSRFEACFPFHPATISVFQRKWQSLPQYQQTRGTLAMFAQWVSHEYQEGYKRARREAVITLGSAPLDQPDFRGIVLQQLGEPRLMPAIDVDIAGERSHARALDADTQGPLRDIHRRVGTSILFESSGGQVDKVAHMPELRFALGELDIDTTSIDTAALALEDKAFYIRRVGSDGFVVRHAPTLKKVVNDRRASLDPEAEVRPRMKAIVREEFERGRTVSLVPFPVEGAAIADSPRLSLVVLDPAEEWGGNGDLGQRIAEWTMRRGKDARLYPGALVWCVKKPGRELEQEVEDWLAWERVQSEIADGTLGAELDPSDVRDLQSKLKSSQRDARDEAWASYRYVVLADNDEPDGLKVIDLGAGHSSTGETLCGRVLSALKAQALLNESVGAGYIERNWPPALKESGEWPLAGLRQSFLNGVLTRLLDPDAVLRTKVVEFVAKGEFGLASGKKPDGSYEHLWFDEIVGSEEVAFDAGVFLLAKDKASALKAGVQVPPITSPLVGVPKPIPPEEPLEIEPTVPAVETVTVRLVGNVPSEVWNRMGTKLVPKLKGAGELQVGIDLKVKAKRDSIKNLVDDIRMILQDLGLSDNVQIEEM